MIDSIIKLPFNRGFRIAIVAIGLVFAPYAFLLHFRPPLIEESNIFKVLANCLITGIPVLAITYTIALKSFLSEMNTLHQQNDKSGFLQKLNLNENELVNNPNYWDKAYSSIILQCLVKANLETTFLFFLPCVIKFWIILSFRNAVYIMIAGFIISVVSDWLDKKRVRTKNLK